MPGHRKLGILKVVKMTLDRATRRKSVRRPWPENTCVARHSCAILSSQSHRFEARFSVLRLSLSWPEIMSLKRELWGPTLQTIWTRLDKGFRLLESIRIRWGRFCGCYAVQLRCSFCSTIIAPTCRSRVNIYSPLSTFVRFVFELQISRLFWNLQIEIFVHFPHDFRWNTK